MNLDPCNIPWQKDRKKDRHTTRKKTSKTNTRKFAGIDGEGWGADKYGRQDYRFILAATDDSTISWCIADDSSYHLHWDKTLQWMLTHLPREYTYCGYGFGYDVTQILRTLPEETIQSLMNPETRTAKRKNGTDYKRFAYTPKVIIGDQYWYFGLDYLPRKQLKIVGWHSQNLGDWDHKGGSWTRVKQLIIWDVFSFFQSSFLKAAEESKIIPTEMLDIISAGKLRRGDNEPHDIYQEKLYCETECRALAMMMANVDKLCKDTGYPLKDFYGAGSIATAMMRAENTKEHTHPVNCPPEVLEACAYAFFGGRFETRMFGHVGDLYENDLHNAYPYIQSQLPCMVHGSWVQVVGFDPKQLGIYYVKWNWFLADPYHGANSWIRPTWAPFMQRSKTNEVHSPPSGEGWVCANEVAAAMKWADTYGYKLEIVGGWKWVTSCPVKPFAYMIDAYETRKQLKAAGDGRQIVYKLGLNSHSGKCDQTVGSAPYHHPFLAAWIKAGCRALIIEAISQAPDQIVAVATDAVYSRVKLNLPRGNDMGQWSEEYKPDAFMMQPGIGWGIGDDAWVKRRGIARLTPELRQKVMNSFVRDGEMTTVTVEQPVFYGLARNRPRYMLGRWGYLPRTALLGPGKKRFILSNRTWESESERTKAHELIAGRPLRDGELPPLELYETQICYDSLPRDGIVGRCGYPYPKFMAFWGLDVEGVENPDDEVELQLLGDETDAVLEREWLLDET